MARNIMLVCAKDIREEIVPAFPRDLAKVVADRWHSMVAGEYMTPPCPPIPLLRQLLEVCYLTSTAAEENRYPRFNVVALPRDGVDKLVCPGKWEFRSHRPLSLGELRRLAPAVDLRKSAIWASWDEKAWSVCGLIDLGTSWYRAREGLGYRYDHAQNLFIQVDRPGRIHVYQGQFRVATLVDGELNGADGIEIALFLHKPANAGLLSMAPDIEWPAYEPPREFESFAFTALWNTYAAVANAISAAGHGGMLIIAPTRQEFDGKLLKMKYEFESGQLRDAFIKFMNARHLMGDYMELGKDGHWVPELDYYKADVAARDSYDALVEATRFVAGLSGCDGSIVVSNDLHLFGFGGEIRPELAAGTQIHETTSEMKEAYKACDIEQFGMRHRAAVKLASQNHDCRILAGPIHRVDAGGAV